jgi:monomeric sarcosine oxidase
MKSLRRGKSSPAQRIVVVGAGAFGGWSALTLLRSGARVTLIDAWGPAHARSSSGDETRLIRSMYNGNPVYTDMVVRAMTLWREAEARWDRQVFYRTGVLYLFEGDDDFATKSLPLMRAHGVAVEALSPRRTAKRFPQLDVQGVRIAYFEPGAGVLLSRAACELVRETFEREGGVYRQAHVSPGRFRANGLADVRLAGGDRVEGDLFVFACGPWLGQVFPAVVGKGIVPTRQDVLYFGTPPGDRRFDWQACPAWLDFGRRRFYGLPSIGRLGFKVADDNPGEPVDPSALVRIASPEAVRNARAFLRRRFPGLASQPVIETRVCQYEHSPDADFLLDRHPGADNVWLVGGGSGHGFKMGPALGEYVARLVMDGEPPHPQFSYAHFDDGRRRTKGSKHRTMHS